MVGEPLLRMGEDFMGVRLPVEMDPPRIGGSGLAGRGCASVGENKGRRNIKRSGGRKWKARLQTGVSNSRESRLFLKSRMKTQLHDLHNHK